MRVFYFTSVPSFHNKHLLGGGVRFEAAAPRLPPGPVASGWLPSAPGSWVRTGRLQAPTLIQPPAETRTFPRTPRGRSQVTGELGAGGWQFRPGPSQGRDGRGAQPVPAAELREPEVKGGVASGPRPAGRQAPAKGRGSAAYVGWNVTGRRRRLGSARSPRGWGPGGSADGRGARGRSPAGREEGRPVSQPRRLYLSQARSVRPASGPPAASSPPPESAIPRLSEDQGRFSFPIGPVPRGSSLPQAPEQSPLSRSATRAGALVCEQEIPKPEFPGPL